MEKVSKESVDARRNESRDESYDEEEADNTANNKEATPELLEKGDIFFFYRPKAKISDDRINGDVKGIEDIRRFFMVTATTPAANTANEQQQFDKTNQRAQEEEGSRYRLFVIGKKSLPEIRTTEARRSE